jgi:tetratricopeptide (TPR) repeat protein
LGRTLFREQSYAEAEIAFRKTIRLRPEWEEAHQMAGASANQQGNYDVALQLYDEGLKAHPKSTKIMVNKWGALYNLGRTSEAIAVLQDVLELEPENDLAIYNLGMSYLRMGSRLEAEDQYNLLRSMGSRYADRLRQELDGR